MKASSVTKQTQNEPTSDSTQSSSLPLPTTDRSTQASSCELALLQFRRLLADYRRAGYEYAQHTYQTPRR